jgi:hypothetical protein
MEEEAPLNMAPLSAALPENKGTVEANDKENILQYKKPIRTAKRRPAYKLSVGLIDTYNCINEVRILICRTTCLTSFLAALLREEENQTV